MTTYYFTCACFNCHKCFKRVIQRNADDNPIPPLCPDCGKATRIMGRKFKCPPKKDMKQWDKIKILLRAGFMAGGHNVPNLDKFPDKLQAVPDFIRNNWRKRCGGCVSKAEKEFGSCPKNAEQIEAFINLWFK